MIEVSILDNQDDVQDDAQAIPYFGQPDGVYESPEFEEDEIERARR